LQEVNSIVADSYEEIKHCQTEQEDHNTKINRTHIFINVYIPYYIGACLNIARHISPLAFLGAKVRVRCYR